ncbi:MAG: hypothetical protein AMXMBFR84_03060 [Candidatus Hydrogenedentota bacterium]
MNPFKQCVTCVSFAVAFTSCSGPPDLPKSYAAEETYQVAETSTVDAPSAPAGDLPESATPLEPKADENPLDHLDSTLRDMSTIVVDLNANPIVQVVEPEKPAPPAPMALEALESQVAALRAEVRTLTDAINELRESTLARIEDENNALRQELARLYALNPSEAPTGAPVPNPDGNPLVEAAEIAVAMAKEDVEKAKELPFNPDDWKDLYGDQGYVVVKDSTRTPEDAKQLGNDVTSLKALILLVPPGIDQDSLAEMARGLRKEFDSFDNIRIDFFDDPEAARLFSNQNVDKTGHHVMNITKHKKSGMDVITRIEGNTTYEVAP